MKLMRKILVKTLGYILIFIAIMLSFGKIPEKEHRIEIMRFASKYLEG